MKRLVIICFLISISILITGLLQPAINPEDFSGRWYSAKDQGIYQFQEGLIYCDKHPVMLSDDAFISGAYSCSRNSIFLFARGIEGLETEKELYLVHKGEGSFLCEQKDGSGMIYFIRYNK